MKNNGHQTERRIEFLEKVYREDRDRWRKNEALQSSLLKILIQTNREVKQQGRRIDAAFRLLYRLMEK